MWLEPIRVIERLQEMIDSSQQFMDTNTIEQGTAEQMRADVLIFREAIRLIKEGSNVSYGPIGKAH